jgi:CheY-like chemotaxis protein
MSLTVAGNEINRVLVLDDDRAARASMSYALTEAGTEAVMEEGPIQSVDAFLASVAKRADAVFSDYRLKPLNYARFQGDELVSACTRSRMPAVLCSTYADMHIMVNRQFMRFIPVILRTTNPGPEQIEDALRRCAAEIAGNIPPSRKPWRTLVRVHEVDTARGYCCVVVPAWDAEQKIPISLESITPAVRGLFRAGKRVHAQVNTGAENHQDLFFDQWELD